MLDEDAPLPVLTAKLWTQCDEPKLLGEWRAVLKPTPTGGGCVGQSTVTFDGYTYDLVQIGDQCWFAENLRSTNYRNGNAIPNETDNDEWISLTTGAQCSYDNDDSNISTYGRLYNWHAVNDPRDLCPSGWHVPTDEEWTTLTDFLGGSGVAGHAMKSSPPAWDGDNESGFSALPGGGRNDNPGSFSTEGYSGYWWSSSPSGSDGAWYRYLGSGNDVVYRYDYSLRSGFSVRCVRD